MEEIYDGTLFTVEEHEEKDFNHLEVISCTYQNTQKVTWEELFDGYDELYAITFSSGVDFTARLFEKFEYAEVIYGCPDIVNPQISAILAMQQDIIERISKNKSIQKIADKVTAGDVRLYVSKDTNSHEKIFILTAKDGRTRVITGSANMSYSAFGGLQREEILYFDDEAAYKYFMKRFDDFKHICANRIESETLNAVLVDESYLKEHVDELPVMQEAKRDIVCISETDDDVDYIATVKNLEEDIKKLVPKKQKHKVLRLDAGDVAVVRKNTRAIQDIAKREEKPPILHLDMDEETLSFDKKPIDLNPDSAQIAKDIDSVIGFFSGFEDFTGNHKVAQRDYFAYMNWYFSTIFMPELRLIADRHGYSTYFFPIFGILCGPSNAGKTKLIEFLSKLMTGKRIKSRNSGTFTSKELNDLREVCEGVPIPIEDLAKTQYDNHYEKILKDDAFGMDGKRINYPAVSITANKIQSLTQDATKRAVYFRVDLATSKEVAAKNAKLVNDNIKSASNALFAEYVRRMIPIVKEMENMMTNGANDYSPDILKESSKILTEIFRENTEVLPDYVRELNFNDYFGEKVIGRTSIEKIQNAYKNQRKAFTVDKKNNTLVYTIPETSAYEIGYLVNELPPSLKPKKMGNTLSMDLAEAKEVFGINFRNKWFWR